MLCNRICEDPFVFTREDDENDFERTVTSSNGDKGKFFMIFFTAYFGVAKVG